MTEKEVKVVFNADMSKLKKAMQEAKNYTNEMQATATTMRREGIAGYRNLEKITKKISGQEKARLSKQSLKQERDLQQQIKQTVRALKEKSRVFKDDHTAIVKEQNALKGLVGSLSKVREERRKLMGGGAGRGGGIGRATGLSGAGAGMGRFIGGFLTSMMAMAAGGILGIVTGQLTQGYQQKIQYGTAAGRLAGMGGKFSNLERIRGRASRRGFGPIELAQQAAPIARATGVVGGEPLMQALSLQRATGMDAGEVAGFMGTLTQAGRGFGGGSKAGARGRQDLIKILALGFESGLDRARMPEFFTSVSQLVTRQMAVAPGAIDPTTAAALLHAMGSSKLSGLQGARGGAVLASLDQAIKSPGGGEAGQAFMMQAFGFGKPGGTASYYQAKKMQQQGISSPGAIQAMFAESKAQYGGGEAQILALSNVTGLSISMLEELRDVVDTNMTDAEMTKAMKAVQAKHASVDEKALAEMQEFGGTLVDIAQLEDRSVGIGEKIEESIKEMRDIINKGVIAALPLVVIALQTMATVMQKIYDFLQETFGTDTEVTGSEEERKKLMKDYAELKEKAASGSITNQDFVKKARALQDKLRAAGAESANISATESAWEGFAKNYTQGLRGMGFDNLTGAGGIVGALAPISSGDASQRAAIQRRIQKNIEQISQETGMPLSVNFSDQDANTLARGVTPSAQRRRIETPATPTAPGITTNPAELSPEWARELVEINRQTNRLLENQQPAGPVADKRNTTAHPNNTGGR